MNMIRILAALLTLAGSPAIAQTTPGSGPLTIAKGGTNATTAGAARSNLGLTIGSAVQAWDADLDALAALSGTNTIYYRSGASSWSAVTVGGLLSFSGGTLNIGDAELAAIAGLTSAADKCFYFTGSGTAATFDCASWSRSVISAVNASAGRAAFGLAIGSDVQAYDAELAALAGLTSANNKCFYWTGTATAATFDCSSYGRGLINAADAAAARTTLGAVIGTDVQAYNARLAAIAGFAATANRFFGSDGAGNATLITLPVAGLALSGGAISFANDLAALEGLASTGFATRTTTDTWAQRTMTGTSNEICVTNGDGVSGNPTFGICSGWLSTAHTWAGVQTFAAPITTGVFDIQGTAKISSFVTSTQITANQNNYTATDGSYTCSTKITLRISTDASRNISGLSCGQSEGDIRVIHNVGSQAVVLTNQDTNSTAANRFLFGGDLTLAADASITIRYDGVTSRWRALITPGAGGGGGGGVTSVTVSPGEGIEVSGTCTITTSGTCTIQLAAAYRQNDGLDRIYASKAISDYRRTVNAFADGYKASAGINGGSSINWSLNTTNGCVGPSASGATVTINSATTTAGIGTLSIVDRTTAVLNSQTVTSIGVYSTSAVTFTIKIVKRNSAGNYDVVVNQGSAVHAGAGWQDFALSSSYAVPGTGTYYLAAYTTTGTVNSTGASISRARSGATNISGTGVTLTEDTGDAYPMRYSYGSGVNNMTVVTTAQTTDSTVTKGRVLLEWSPIDATTLNTDLTAELSCNGGTNWTSASLSAVTAYSGGSTQRNVAESADTTCGTSGTSFAARIKSLNNKNLQIYGTSINVR